jgi:hypothetical protein
MIENAEEHKVRLRCYSEKCRLGRWNSSVHIVGKRVYDNGGKQVWCEGWDDSMRVYSKDIEVRLDNEG